MVEVDENAYTQWLEWWLRQSPEPREAVPALGPSAAHAVGPAVPPAGLRPTSASGPDLPLPDESLYWKVANSSEHAGKMAKALSVGDGEDGEVSLLLQSNVRTFGAGGIEPVVFKRSDVENITRETFDAWVAKVSGAPADDDDGDSSPPPSPYAQQTRDADDDDDEDADRKNSASAALNDSASAALNKFLTYVNMKEQTGTGCATALRVRGYALRGTCPRHPFRDHAPRLVHFSFRRLCTRASVRNCCTRRRMILC